jgi:plastocyanin
MQMPIDLASMAWLAGGLVVSLLVVGSAGAAVVRRRHLRTLALADGSAAGGSAGVDMARGAQQHLAVQRTAFAGPSQVAIQNFAFEPAEARVAVGATITWTNYDLVAHTVTFRNGMADSGLMRPRQTFSHTFTSPGVFEYYCRVHPNMVGSVVVAA